MTLKTGVVLLLAAVASCLVSCATTGSGDGQASPTARPTRQGTLSYVPRYLRLRPGLRLYVWSPDSQSTMARQFADDSQAVLLKDLATVQKWSTSDGDVVGSLPHYDESSGSIVIVKAWKHVHKKSTGDDALVVQVATASPSSDVGWIENDYLLPIIPIGSPLLVNDYMFFTPNFNRLAPNKGIHVAPNTPATLVEESPNVQSGPFYVTIASGPLRGKRGYFNQIETKVRTGSLDSPFYERFCHCVPPWPLDG